MKARLAEIEAKLAQTTTTEQARTALTTTTNATSNDVTTKATMAFVATVRFSAFKASSDIDSNAWIIDSGATRHMINDRTAFETYEDVAGVAVQIAEDGRSIPATGQGNVTISVRNAEGHITCMQLTNVLHVPRLGRNLFSVIDAAKKGARIEFDAIECRIRNAAGRIVQGPARGDQYLLIPVMPKAQVSTTTVTTTDRQLTPSAGVQMSETWHRRLGHVGHGAILNTAA